MPMEMQSIEEVIEEPTLEAPEEKPPEETKETQGPTAKQMAAAEEINSMRAKALSEQADKDTVEPVALADIASRGYEALHEAFRQHREAAANRKEYVPPPRTERQMSLLEEELEAGRKAGERARQQQEASAAQRASEAAAQQLKEGFTTPVYRPDNIVPDPLLTGSGKAGQGTYGGPDTA